MGVITPLGHCVEELFRAQVEGRSGVGRITAFNASRFPTQIAAEVKGFDLGRYVRHPERWANAGANSRFAAAAAQQALADSGLLEASAVDRTRCGVYLGTGEGTQDFEHLIPVVARSYQPDRHGLDSLTFTAGAFHDLHARREYEQELHTTPAHVAAYFDLQGPNYT
jgi:3-oxoacyl-[acyl-carrier-protein] synthase II